MQPPPDSLTIDAHHRFHAAMFAVSAGSDDERRRSHSSPKFGKHTASSSPTSSSHCTRAVGLQYESGNTSS